MSASLIVTRKVKHLATYMNDVERWTGNWHPICRERAEAANHYGGREWIHFTDITTPTDPELIDSWWWKRYLRHDGIAKKRPWCKGCRKVLASLNELVDGQS